MYLARKTHGGPLRIYEVDRRTVRYPIIGRSDPRIRNHTPRGWSFGSILATSEKPDGYPMLTAPGSAGLGLTVEEALRMMP